MNNFILYSPITSGLFGPNAHEHIQVQPPPANDTLLRVRIINYSFN